MGAITPIGNTLSQFEEGLKTGANGIDYISIFDASNHKTTFAGEIKNLNFEDHFPKPDIRKMDRHTLFALISVEEAFINSKIDLNSLNVNKCGVIWGSAISGIKTFEDEIANFYSNPQKPSFSPYFIPKIIPDIVSGLVAIKYGFLGVNFAAVSACASATHSIIAAYQNIKLGKANLIIAGGSEAAITPSGIGGFNAFKGLSQRNSDPKKASRPFDIDRDGFVVGEGAGALILEDLEHAQARNAPIIAEITGTGMTCDAYHITASHPDGFGAYLAFKEALIEAGLDIGEIDYINTHATSTQLGDISEMKAINRLVEESQTKIDFLISSTKSMTGHLLGAAGAIELIAALLSMKNNIIPATINTQEIDPEIPLKNTICLHKSTPKIVKNIASFNFGFGGHNAAIIATEYS